MYWRRQFHCDSNYRSGSIAREFFFYIYILSLSLCNRFTHCMVNLLYLWLKLNTTPPPSRHLPSRHSVPSVSPIIENLSMDKSNDFESDRNKGYFTISAVSLRLKIKFSSSNKSYLYPSHTRPRYPHPPHHAYRRVNQKYYVYPFVSTARWLVSNLLLSIYSSNIQLFFLLFNGYILFMRCPAAWLWCMDFWKVFILSHSTLFLESL